MNHRTEVTTMEPALPFQPQTRASSALKSGTHALNSAQLESRMLEALPANARNVLQIGADKTRLPVAWRTLTPETRWTLADTDAQALVRAGSIVDERLQIDPDGSGLEHNARPFDAVLMDGIPEEIAHPGALFSALNEVCTPDATLVLRITSASQISQIAKLLSGDLAHEPYHGPASAWTEGAIFKALLDTGWAPVLKDALEAAPTNVKNEGALINALTQAAQALGLPQATAHRFLGLGELIIEAKRVFNQTVPTGEPCIRFAVGVPVTDMLQFERDVAASPGLAEVDATVVFCREAQSAADAFERCRARTDAEWIVLAHQDVYFARGFGARLQAAIDTLPDDKKRHSVIGFAGVGLDLDEAGTPTPSGFVIDRTERFDHPESQLAISIDELAVVLHRDTQLAIDPALGWHLWATDLCIQAIVNEPPGLAAIIRAPVYHHSYNDGMLPQTFRHAAQILLTKHDRFQMIPTLCGVIKRT